MAVTAIPSTPQARGGNSARALASKLTPTAIVLPALLVVIAVQVVPAAIALFESFRKVEYFQDRGAAGFENYARVLDDPAFWRSLQLSASYTVACVVLGLGLALGSALLIHRLGSLGSTLATFLLIPWALSQMVVALLSRWILAPYGGGLLNALLAIIGVGPVALLGSSTTAMPTLIAVSVWRNFAFAALILSAGLAQIPRNLGKASRIDGASKWQEFRYVTLPLLRPSIVISVVILCISYFNEIQLIIGLTDGGPAGSTQTLAYYLYNEGVVNFHTGTGNAISVLMFIFNIVLVGLLVYVSGRVSRIRRRAL